MTAYPITRKKTRQRYLRLCKQRNQGGIFQLQVFFDQRTKRPSAHSTDLTTALASEVGGTISQSGLETV